MESESVLDRFKRLGVIMTNGHFVYRKNRRHGPGYVNKDAALVWTPFARGFGEELAEPFVNDRVETVIGPAVGGAILSQWTAHALACRTSLLVASTYADKDGENFVIRRGYELHVKGRRTLVVDDVLNSGDTVAKLIEAVRAVGGEVVGLSVLCNRGGVLPEAVGNPPKMNALLDFPMETYAEADCPLCQAGLPIMADFGRGAEFLARTEKQA